MAKSNPNITPIDGIAEGDLLELLINPTALGSPATLSALTFQVKNGGTVTDYNLSDFSDVSISGEDDIPDGDYKSIKVLIGPKLNQFQFVSTGDVIATDLAYVIAEPKPI